jgi:hypothetical protein
VSSQVFATLAAVGRMDGRKDRAAGRVAQQHAGVCFVVLYCPSCFQQYLLSCSEISYLLGIFDVFRNSLTQLHVAWPQPRLRSLTNACSLDHISFWPSFAQTIIVQNGSNFPS